MSGTIDNAAGGCLCGAVRYTVRDVGTGVTECHCGQCRRQSGHRYATVPARWADVALEGGEAVTWFRASDAAERGFCTRCGSHLFWRANDDGRVAILAASLDDGAALAMARHIYVESKPAYYEIDDGLPRFRGYDTPAGA